MTTPSSYAPPLRPIASSSHRSLLSPPVVRAVALAGLAAGVADAADGVAWYGITAGQNPIQVLQYIASGALGVSAFSGGLATAGLGALLHFALAYAFTAAFAVAYLRSQVVRDRWLPVSLGYGAAVWALMNLVVLPLSAVPPSALTVGLVLNGVIGHALFVGATGAYVLRRVLGEQA